MSEFKLGNLVAYKDFHIDFLLKIDIERHDKDLFGYKGAKREYMNFHSCANEYDIRLATEKEIKAGRRL